MFFKIKNYLYNFIVLCYLFNQPLLIYASNHGDEDLNFDPEMVYSQGVQHRKKGEYTEALDCFMSVIQFAKLGEELCLKSDYNIGHCYHLLEKNEDAYKWFRKGADAQFQPAKKALGQLNLFHLLLPNEMISHISSFLSLKDQAMFARSSEKNYHAVIGIWASENFLTSSLPCAKDIMFYFSQMTMTPPPSSIRLGMKKKIRDADAHVYFRDSDHLRKIVEQTQDIGIMRGKRIFFIQDEKIEDGSEILSSQGDLVESIWFINIIHNAPLELKGSLRLPIALVLPRRSKIDKINLNIERGLLRDLPFKTSANELASVIDNFDPLLFKIRTSDAKSLMAETSKNPENDPDFDEYLKNLCPDHFVIGTDLQEVHSRYIDSKAPLVYCANSLASLVDLYQELPDFQNSISYINPCQENAGVYSIDPLTCCKLITLESSDDLVMAGRLRLYEHSLCLISKGNMYLLNINIKADLSLSFVSHGNLLSKGYLDFNSPVVPEGIPSRHWQHVRNWWMSL